MGTSDHKDGGRNRGTALTRLFRARLQWWLAVSVSAVLVAAALWWLVTHMPASMNQGTLPAWLGSALEQFINLQARLDGVPWVKALILAYTAAQITIPSVMTAVEVVRDHAWYRSVPAKIAIGAGATLLFMPLVAAMLLLFLAAVGVAVALVFIGPSWLVWVLTAHGMRVDADAITMLAFVSLALVVLGLVRIYWSVKMRRQRAPERTYARVRAVSRELGLLFACLICAFLPVAFRVAWGWILLGGLGVPVAVSLLRVNYAEWMEDAKSDVKIHIPAGVEPHQDNLARHKRQPAASDEVAPIELQSLSPRSGRPRPQPARVKAAEKHLSRDEDETSADPAD